MREDLQHKKIGPVEGLLYILAIVAVLALVVLGIGFIAYLLHRSYITIVSFVIIVIGATLLMRSRLQNYAYVLSRGYFILMRCLGSNEKVLLSTRIVDILWAGRLSQLPERYRKTPREKATFHRNEDFCCVVCRNQDGRERVALFSPGEKFWALLQEQMEKRQKKNAGEQPALDEFAAREAAVMTPSQQEGDQQRADAEDD